MLNQTISPCLTSSFLLVAFALEKCIDLVRRNSIFFTRMCEKVQIPQLQGPSKRSLSICLSLSLHFLFQIGDSNDGENQLVPRPPSAGKSRLPLTPPRHTALTKARMVRFLVYSLSRWSPRGPFIIRKLMGFSEWQKRFWENRGQVI